VQHVHELEHTSVEVQGLLLVHHDGGAAAPAAAAGGGGGVLGSSDKQHMQLVPLAEAVRALHVRPHQIRQTCKLQCSPSVVAAARQQQAEQQQQQPQQQQPQQQQQLVAAVAQAVEHEVGPSLAQQLCLQEQQVRLRTFSVRAEPPSGSGLQVLTCSWLLADDALAQRCVSVLAEQLPATQ
jgi:hypothetical protein